MELGTTMDLLPTFCSLSNTPLPQDRTYDGYDISPLLQQTDDANTLQVLNLHENLISDITPAQHLLQLKGLDVSRNRLTQLPDLSMLRHLNLLSINFNHISDLSGVANNPKLHVLEMSNMGAVSLASLGQVLEHLTFLDAHFNQLNDIRPLELAERLVELDLTKNNLSDIKTLNVLPKIKHVEIGGNQITYAQCMDMLAPRSDREHLCSSIKRWDDQF